MTPASEKHCRWCQTTKPIDDFYPHKAMHDGRLSKCKECTKAAVRLHRRLNESVREYDRRRGARATSEYQKSYRERFPAAYYARNAVNNAVRDGRLTKEPCLFCGETRVHGHHRDYSRPLDVIWLCARCHHRLHAYFPETAAHEPKKARAA